MAKYATFDGSGYEGDQFPLPPSTNEFPRHSTNDPRTAVPTTIIPENTNVHFNIPDVTLLPNVTYTMVEVKKEAVDHPSHYGGKDNPYEAIKVIRAWGLGFSLGNTVKYISRAGKKDPAKTIEDLEKALWYLKEEIDFLKRG